MSPAATCEVMISVPLCLTQEALQRISGDGQEGKSQKFVDPRSQKRSYMGGCTRNVSPVALVPLRNLRCIRSGVDGLHIVRTVARMTEWFLPIRVQRSRGFAVEHTVCFDDLT